MPRSTAKSKQNVNGNSSKTKRIEQPKANMAPKPMVTPRKRTTVKREPESTLESNTEQVSHRKSERRRVARDIFLVFEEQPSTRRTTRGSNKKVPKPKFGHLRVEDPIKPKNLLRDIKNEPKCYLGSGEPINLNLEKNSKTRIINNCPNIWSSSTCTSQTPDYSKIVSSEITNVSTKQTQVSIGDVFHVAKVNPIFLWAKQDNTRIIEVRCEDYDKRNRIRITKTSNGWRAMPRSDPTTSKVLKLYSTPLLKVKRENANPLLSHLSQTANVCNVAADKKPVLESEITKDVFSEPTNVEVQTNGIDEKTKPLSKKYKKNKSNKRKKQNSCKKTAIKINVECIEDSGLPNCDSLVSTSTMGACIVYGDTVNCAVQNGNSTIVSNIVDDAVHITNGLKNRESPSSRNCTGDILGATYQNSSEDDGSFHLCPKTGLFLRSVHNADQDSDVELMEYSINKNPHLDEKINALDTKQNSVDENNESLEAKTRNLKDLLDDADLFQHCDDNANSDADLIDTLVKSSCEHNLIQDNVTSAKNTEDILQNKDMSSAELVNEPPKCLSFNEAGEIEALNCELFHPNEFMDTFEKQACTTVTDDELGPNNVSVDLQPIILHNNTTMENASNLYNVENNKNNHIIITEEAPKDLSYKKREEVCPPSESRSQCAVTSSSDIVKSPNMDDSSVLASSSETIKNLILEQFIKLNTLSGHSKSQIEDDKPIEIEHLNSIYSKCVAPSNLIETVIIDDEDSTHENTDAEPLKKRLRSNVTTAQKLATDEYNVKSNMAIIDKDPDPLTQLRLLIRNSQWKVPDPILVPKDRLSAVLASPAREIPLLITTRPELRLPEAFAYPEIIQNPNILVISMAQLEAILKNEMEVEKPKIKDMGLNKSSSSLRLNTGNKLKCGHESRQTGNTCEMPEQYCTNEELLPKPTFINTSTAKEETVKLSHIENNLSSNLNATTMAVLNQMLWLPYFGQISQEIIKTVKAPNSTSSNNSLLPPNVSSLQSNQLPTNISTDNKTLGGIFANTALKSVLKPGQTEELTLFQKILQHQMQNVLNLSHLKDNVLDKTSDKGTALPTNTNQSVLIEPTKNKVPSVENPKAKNILSTNNMEVAQSSSVDGLGKTYNLRSSSTFRQGSDYSLHPNSKRPNTENKPRLTCKSLSNLLDPEHHQTHNTSLSTIQTRNVSNIDTEYQKTKGGAKDISVENYIVGGINMDASPLTSSIRQQRNTRNFDAVSEFAKHKPTKTSDNITFENGAKPGEPMVSNESNIPLWHPLFGSNSKSAYSSPWQWTTVTAAGE
ncbi:uncharacterized protein LOC106094970 [Stomoxys calcitrans]|uniref:Uncharacterized protein n=1 Tax=Stomoxys calcitrans TaxID=35570 RepID=A0A1I8NRM5_STOCA|nr:uncharacterized protein LOC106094970 [Stomoxys calcitrans]